MPSRSLPIIVRLTAILLIPCTGHARESYALDSTKGLQPHDVTVEAVTYQGRKAVRVLPAAAADAELVAPKNGEGGGIVVLSDVTFHDGTIEVDVAGKPRAGATAGARGFVGVAFRVATDPSKYECFYIRPTNGRADDQLRRNHSAQYISMQNSNGQSCGRKRQDSTNLMWTWCPASGRRSKSK